MNVPAQPLRTLIVDDEPLAVERLQLMCAAVPNVTIVGTAGNGADAIGLARTLEPDLILLDIDMPEIDGMAVARAISNQICGDTRPPPSIIFVTAFEGFALEAFDISATDYILKPVAQDRLVRAIERVCDRRLHYARPETSDVTYFATEFWVPHRSELVRISANAIDRIDAERDYMRLHVGAKSYLLHQTISGLEAKLDSNVFIRLHRSVIVRRDRIIGMGHDKAGAWHAELANGDLVRIGRTHVAAAKAMVGR